MKIRRVAERASVKYRLKRLRGRWYANMGLWPSMGACEDEVSREEMSEGASSLS